jgi:hypothetical protein
MQQRIKNQGANKVDRGARLARLSRRSRQLVEVLVCRPELSVVDAAALLDMAVSNARKRLREVYSPSCLDCEGRTHMVAAYGDVVESEETPENGDASSV